MVESRSYTRWTSGFAPSQTVTVLRMTETRSCTVKTSGTRHTRIKNDFTNSRDKNVRVRDHEGYKYVLSMVETPSYTRENTSNRPYTVQMYLQTTRTLQNSAIAKNTKSNIKQAKIQLKARRRRKFFQVFLSKGLSHAPPGGGGCLQNLFF